MDRWLFEGKIYAEWVFRGKNLGVYEFSKDLNRSDWQLVHKYVFFLTLWNSNEESYRHQEKSYTSCSTPMQELVLPDSFPLPPLQVHLSQKSARKNGMDEKSVSRRAPLLLSIDPEFQHLKPFIRQVLFSYLSRAGPGQFPNFHRHGLARSSRLKRLFSRKTWFFNSNVGKKSFWCILSNNLSKLTNLNSSIVNLVIKSNFKID